MMSKKNITSGMLVWGLLQSSAFATVVDKFQCKITAYDKNGKIAAVASNGSAAVIRREGTSVSKADPETGKLETTLTSTNGELVLELEGDVGIWIQLLYTHWLTNSKDAASQTVCLVTWYGNDKKAELSHKGNCEPVNLNSFNPIELYPKTTVSPSGTPIFRSEDLISSSTPIKTESQWSSFDTECSFHGTTEYK